ncbi:NAD-dependent epimerase/dehydratase family protein [Mycobacterium simiae]|uniref:NAD-dependent epimerase/dehydratase family protein n=1 Tax=Mycobacterium simiae TaxID=1784 RepID=UPI00159464DD|nr:NAD(P)-dependent oxidoreductase [Mycobacterium simiae]
MTGGSGFLGQAVCKELLARDHAVAVLVRTPGSEPLGTTPVPGDLTDADSLTAAVRSLTPDCVIHLAAEIGTQRNPRKIYDVNVHGMRRLVAACESAGVRRMVFVSTVVTGEAHGAVLTEDLPVPVHTAYGRSKHEGEQILHESTLDGVVIRPGHIYGPGGWFLSEIVTRLRQPGRFVVVGDGTNMWDVVHVDDVAQAVIGAAEKATPGTVLHCVADEGVTQYEFVARTARELGVGAPRRSPLWLARLVMGDGPAKTVVRSARTCNAKLKTELGWTPRYPTIETGIPAAVAAITR